VNVVVAKRGLAQIPIQWPVSLYTLRVKLRTPAIPNVKDSLERNSQDEVDGEKVPRAEATPQFVLDPKALPFLANLQSVQLVPMILQLLRLPSDLSVLNVRLSNADISPDLTRADFVGDPVLWRNGVLGRVQDSWVRRFILRLNEVVSVPRALGPPSGDGSGPSLLVI